MKLKKYKNTKWVQLQNSFTFQNNKTNLDLHKTRYFHVSAQNLTDHMHYHLKLKLLPNLILFIDPPSLLHVT